MSVQDYVHSLEKVASLLDKLADVPMDQDGAGGKSKTEDGFLYDEHLSLVEVQSQLKSGTVHKGKFRTSPYNYLEGSVTISLGGEETTVLIQGREAINRAVNEDVVAIRILPREQWTIRSELIIDENAIEDGGEDVVTEETDAPKTSETKTDRPVGRVVAIIKRNWRSYCGVIREKTNVTLATSNFLFVPVDKRIPFVRIQTRQYSLLQGKKILVSLDSWPRDSKYPRGHYTKIIGEAMDKETETDVLLLEHNVPHTEFSAQVLNCLPAEGPAWVPKEADLVNRQDLRDIVVCSVDPPGCTDIDDALHCRPLADKPGVLEVGVHIADVSHFIKPNTAIDREAAERGTTVYLADRRIDMVPGLLSSNLCSLREAEERLSFSCIWQIEAATGDVLETHFTKSIIKSRAALTYGEAQMKIDSVDDTDEVTLSLRRLNALAKLLKAKRIAAGALVLASANEIKFVEVESETAENELQVVEKKLLETNSMVEEFMLLANISVAKKIYEIFPNFAVLRRHPKPSAANFEELVKAAANRGFSIDVSDGISLSKSLEQAVDPTNEHLNLMLRMITTRCMSQAVYFCSGALSSEPDLTFAHYGLATDIYTHFTSPIRRYADVMVHRLLAHAVGHETLAPTILCKRKIADVCEHINTRNMNARRASRSSNELHSYLYVRREKSGVVNEVGHVFTLKDNALIIFIMHLSFEVVYSFDPADWDVDKEAAVAVHRVTGTRLRQFDRVRVQLSIDTQAMVSSFKKQILVRLVEPDIPCEQRNPKQSKGTKKMKKT